MAGGRSTEVLEKETGNVTQRLVEPAKKTERMEQRNPANVSLWPPKNFVPLWMTKSAPKAKGF